MPDTIDSATRSSSTRAHESAIDLQVLDRQPLQMRERAQARAEVVERDLAARARELANELLGRVEVVHGRGFLDLEAKRGRRQAGLRELLEHERRVLAARDRLRRDVDREAIRQIRERMALGAQRVDRRAHDPAVERGQQLVALGSIEKLVGREELTGRAAHPHEQLVADDLTVAGAQPDDGLGLESKIVVLQRVLQARRRE